MEAKHTPGPWRVGLCGSVVSDYPVKEIPGSEEVEYYGGHLIAESIAPKNAALIAAAPDLLEACVEFVRKCECGEARSKRSYAQMKAAIQKAAQELFG